jgi:hypothetical protein
MYKKILGILLLSPVLAFAGLVEKEMTISCGDSTAIIAAIKSYSETPVWVAKESTGYTVSLWQNIDKKTFTMLKTDASGKTSCVISVGVLFTPV